MKANLIIIRVFILFILLTINTGCFCISSSLYSKEIVTEYKNDLVSAKINADNLYLTTNMSSHYKNSDSVLDSNVPAKLQCNIRNLNLNKRDNDITHYVLNNDYREFSSASFKHMLHDMAVSNYTIMRHFNLECKYVKEFSNSVSSNNILIVPIEELNSLSDSIITKYKQDNKDIYVLIYINNKTINITRILGTIFTERNEFFHVVKGVLYPVTFPLDIITYPIQLLTLHSGKCLGPCWHCPDWTNFFIAE